MTNVVEVVTRNIRFSLSFSDVDECTPGSHDCLQSLASCSNTHGSHNCYCQDGYVGDGKTFCNPKGRDYWCFKRRGDGL